MKTLFIALSSCCIALLFSACSESTNNPDNTNPLDTSAFISNLPFHGKGYDFQKGGLQIARVYYDQGDNNTTAGIFDEWIILIADKNIPTKGWHLNAGDSTQNYSLPDTVYKSLTIYTHEIPSGKDSLRSMGLHITANVWIWNNTVADTAYVYDDKNVLIDQYSY